MREFVVGTGGKSLFARKYVAPNSEVYDNTTFGVMVLTLLPSSYDWRFVPEAAPGNGTFTDQGSAACHRGSRFADRLVSEREPRARARLTEATAGPVGRCRVGEARQAPLGGGLHATELERELLARAAVEG